MQKFQIKLSTALWLTTAAAFVAAVMGFIARSGDWTVPLLRAPLVLLVGAFALASAFVVAYVCVLPFSTIVQASRRTKDIADHSSDPNAPAVVGVRQDNVD